MYFFNKEFKQKIPISDFRKKEIELISNKKNILTFIDWYEILNTINEENRADLIGFFDYETTHMNGRAVSMAIIVYSLSKKEVVSEYYWEFKNPIPMDSESVKIHGLTEEYLSDKDTFISSYDSEIHEVMKKIDIFIAHNSAYDVSVFGRELYSVGRKCNFEFRVMDSAPLLKAQMKERKYNLEFCADFFKVDKSSLGKGLTTDFHNALYDCRILLEVFKKAIEG